MKAAATIAMNKDTGTCTLDGVLQQQRAGGPVNESDVLDMHMHYDTHVALDYLKYGCDFQLSS